MEEDNQGRGIGCGKGGSRIEGDDVKVCIYGPKRSGWFTQVEWSGYWTSATPSDRPSAG